MQPVGARIARKYQNGDRGFRTPDSRTKQVHILAGMQSIVLLCRVGWEGEALLVGSRGPVMKLGFGDRFESLEGPLVANKHPKIP